MLGSPERPIPAAALPARIAASPLLAGLAAALAALIWGGWFPLSRLAVTGALTPADLALLRFGLAGLVLLPYAWRHGLKAGRLGWPGALAMALCIGAPYPLFLAMGLQHAPAAHAAVFVPGVFPVLTFLMGVLVLGDPVTRRRLLGVGLVLAGAALVGWHALVTIPPGALSGYAFFFACAVMWSIYTIVARAAQVSAIQATAIISVLSLLGYLPFYLLFADSGFGRADLGELAFHLLYQSVLVGLLAIFCYNHAVNLLGAAPAAVFGGLVPCIAALLAVPVLNEPLGWPELAGIAAVTGGILLVTGIRWRRRAPSGRAL